MRVAAWISCKARMATWVYLRRLGPRSVADATRIVNAISGRKHTCRAVVERQCPRALTGARIVVHFGSAATIFLFAERECLSVLGRASVLAVAAFAGFPAPLVDF